MRFYFHIDDGATLFDDEGIEFGDIAGIKNETLQSCADMVKDIRGDGFWSGKPWRIWVTDQPNGGGNTLLTMTLTALLSG